MLALYPRAALVEDDGLPAEGGGFGGSITFACNARSREQVDAVLADPQELGASLLKPAHDASGVGGASGYFADSDGHPWEVARNPFFPMPPTDPPAGLTAGSVNAGRNASAAGKVMPFNSDAGGICALAQRADDTNSKYFCCWDGPVAASPDYARGWRVWRNPLESRRVRLLKRSHAISGAPTRHG